MGQKESSEAFRPLTLGDKFPDFTAKCTKTISTPGRRISWHPYIDGHWAILFSHPAAYTPICTMELGTIAKMMDDFTFRGVKLCGLSCDSIKKMEGGWIEDIEHLSGTRISFPIIDDSDRVIAVKLGMLDKSTKDELELPLPVRAVYIIGPDKRLKLCIFYPAHTGRNFTEILRVIDSLQLEAAKDISTPPNWCPGEDVYVYDQNISDSNFPKGVTVVDVPSGKNYIRRTPYSPLSDCKTCRGVL